MTLQEWIDSIRDVFFQDKSVEIAPIKNAYNATKTSLLSAYQMECYGNDTAQQQLEQKRNNAITAINRILIA